jgi:ribose transport system permease protein
MRLGCFNGRAATPGKNRTFSRHALSLTERKEKSFDDFDLLFRDTKRSVNWGISGVGLTNGSAARQKTAAYRLQDNLYTVTELKSDMSMVTRVVGAMAEYLRAPENPQRVLDRLTDPTTRIVSLTVTEGGYNLGLIVSLVPNYSFLGFETCLFTGLVLGLTNGALIAFLRLPPFIVTLGSLTAVRGVARLFSNDRTIFNSDLPFAFIGNQTFYGVPWLMVIALSVIIVSWYILKRTVLGVRIYAVGGNADAARLAGIKVPLILIIVYGISGLLAWLGGAMSAARLFAANGVQLGQSYELDAIAAVILGGTSFVGGTGSIWGTLVGALIIAVLSNGLVLTGVSDIWQYIIKGLVIIGAVTLDRYRLAKTARS